MTHRLLVIFLLIGVTWSIEEKYKLCAPETILDSTCNSLTRGSSKVSCLRVTDNAECAIRLSEGKADFGVFDAEEMLLAYQFYPDEIKVVSQLRHVDRQAEEFQFRSVVVVPASFETKGDLAGLKNAGLCHPGFSDTQLWNDRILKHFEKKVYTDYCRGWNTTAEENEIENLKGFFGKACRPGEWVADESQDKILKSRHRELCELCDDTSNCKYHNTAHHGHFGALECLVSGRGNVSYVAYEYVRQFFGLYTNITQSPLAVPIGFKFLCRDGTTKPLTSSDPCAWVSQPVNAIVARTEKSNQVLEGLKSWLPDVSEIRAPIEWTTVLKSILTSDVKPRHFQQPWSLRNYLSNGRDVDVPHHNPCVKKIRWCTVNEQENVKCNWIAREAIVGLDIVPEIECVIATSTLECMKNISESEADIMTIDSNYGHIARQVFDLTTIMYAETDSDKNSQVVAVVLEDAQNKVTSFHDLKQRTACFPEYGGIAWLSFLNVARTKKIISDSCDYPKIVSNFFSGACTPGIMDSDHSKVPPSPEVASVLCSLCLSDPGFSANCSANKDNYFYGDKGALDCVTNRAGDIAFVETKNLLGHLDGKLINPNKYRVLCKNGSLAMYTGFDVDEPCALSVTIDSEVIGRNGNGEKNTIQVLPGDVTSALLKLENWLGYRPEVLRPIRIYDSFTGSSNLLFKDSTVGLVPPSAEIKSVMAYKELFRHLESCSGVESIIANVFTVFLVALFCLARFN